MLTVAVLFAYAGIALRWPEIVPQWFAGSSDDYATSAAADFGGSAADDYAAGAAGAY